MGDQTDNCEDASNENSLAFSGNFGVFLVGEIANAGSVLLSRLTAEGPTAEPDSGNYQSFILQMMKTIMGQQMKLIMEVML